MSGTSADGDGMYDGDTVVGSEGSVGGDTMVNSEGSVDGDDEAGSEDDSVKGRALDPGLPNSNPTESYWQDSPPFPHLDISPDDTPACADVVIIGSGMTAAGVALSLLPLMASKGKAPVVFVAEARKICSGATARNAGHINIAPHGVMSLHKGLQEPKKILDFQVENAKALKELGPVYPLADVREFETVHLYHDGEEFEKDKASVKDLREKYPQYEVKVLEGDEVPKTYANSPACGAISHWTGSFRPYHFVTSIWGDLRSQYPNLRISTNNPVEDITITESSSHPYSVTCSRGTLQARHVVHATDSHATHLLPGLKLGLTGGSMHMLAQISGAGFPKCEGGRSWTLRFGDNLYNVIQRPDMPYEDGKCGDLLMIGSAAFHHAAWDDGVYDKGMVNCLKECMKSVFGPQLGEAKIWSGTVGITGDLLPFVGRIPPQFTGRENPSGQAAVSEDSGLVTPGEWISAGYHGHGVTFALLSGQALGVQIAGMEDKVLKGVKGVNGIPGGKLDDWFPRKELSLDGNRLERANMKDLLEAEE